MWRRPVAGIELRHSLCYWAAALLPLLGALLLVLRQPPFQGFHSWTSTWPSGVQWLNGSSVVLGPLIIAGAAWLGGREQRHGMSDLVGSTPRPPRSRLLWSWGALGGGVVTGFLLYSAIVAAATAPGAVFTGGRWPGAWVLVGLGWLTCAAVGCGLGRVVHGRLVAPAAGLIAYVGFAVLDYFGAQWIQLAPVALLPVSDGSRLVGRVLVLAPLWLLAVAALFVVPAVTMRRRWVAVPASLAAALAVALTTLPVGGDEFAGASWSEPDPSPIEVVCTQDDGPRVCLFERHSGLLPAVTPIARGVLDTTSSLAGIGTAVESGAERPAPDGVLALPSLTGQSLQFRPGLADPVGLRRQIVLDLTVLRCPTAEASNEAYSSPEVLGATDVAAALISPADFVPGEEMREVFERLAGDPAAARRWITNYVAAAQSCDVPALNDLGGNG